MEESPYYEMAKAQLLEQGDKLVELASSDEFVEALVPLPMEVVYVLTMGVAVRLVASGTKHSNERLETLVGATWGAITKAA
jgi:hypothetical protein